MNNDLIKIDLNQTISRFEQAEITKENNRWALFSFVCVLFISILGFEYYITQEYNELISLRLEDADNLSRDAKTNRDNYSKQYGQDSLNFSIEEKDIDRLYSVERDRISWGKKLQLLSSFIPENMSLIDFEYQFKDKKVIIKLASDKDNYSTNKRELAENIQAYIDMNDIDPTRSVFNDGDFKYYDIKRLEEEIKQQKFFVVELTLSNKRK